MVPAPSSMKTVSEEKNWTVEVATFCPVRHRKAEWASPSTRERERPAPVPPSRTCDFQRDYTPAIGRSSDSQVRAWPSYRPSLPSLLRPVLITAFVPAYRCGAVPDFHRVPFSLQFLKTNSKMNIRQACFESQHESGHCRLITPATGQVGCDNRNLDRSSISQCY